MSDYEPSNICQMEHIGKISHNNNSWNHNDDEGQDVSNLLGIALTTSVFFGLCLTITLLLKNKFMKVLFGLVSLGLFAVSIAFFVQFGMHVGEKPISMVYFLSHYLTKVVRTQPRLNADDVFPGHIDFENDYKSIQTEVLELAEKEDMWPLTKNIFGNGNEVIGGDVSIDANTGKEVGWRFFMISVGDKFSPQAEVLLPTLTRLIKKHKDVMVSCAISMLPPHVKIPPHVGYSKAVVRYMLPIELPTEQNRCFMCLNGKDEHWELGKSFAFDDCFIHSVHNDSSQRRIVIYADVLRAMELAINKIGKGERRAKIIDKAARSFLNKKYGIKNFQHGLGHGVGTVIHEWPNFKPKSEDVVPPGCVMTIEPGIYLKGLGGVRIEDMILITKNGYKNLTKVPKNLENAIINLY